MLFAWSMTLLARHTKYVISSTVLIGEAGIGNGFEERCMTLETSRHDRSAEIDRSVSIAGTVDPTPHFRPIGNRQLKELILFVPVEVSLSLAPGADDKVKSLRGRNRVRRSSEHARLEEAIWLCFHTVVQFALRSFENVFARSKTAGNRTC